MDLQSNPELELAYEYITYTSKNVYLTGKAGTGKTTFLQRIKDDPIKRMAVVAPTGVAAINVEGMTVHAWGGFGKQVVVCSLKCLYCFAFHLSL